MDTAEFYALVEQGGMNRCLLYASWCSRLLEIARKDTRMLAALKSTKQIVYTGASLNPDNEQWIYAQGIPVTLMYATTEIGKCHPCIHGIIQRADH
jgi:acyl-coenzyme A synthetase/AMP-(fatty) acid ligase